MSSDKLKALEKKPSTKKSAVAAAAAAVVVVLVLIMLVPGAKAEPRFVLASWDYPDEYGQGIAGFGIYENSTGVWETVDVLVEHDEPSIFNWTVGVAIKLICYTWINSTFLGWSSESEGRNFQRHNVTVKTFGGTTVFSQQNFTFVYSDSLVNPPMWYYGYSVVLNFLPAFGEYYTVTVIYELCY